MLGRRDPQRSLFDADSLPHRVPPDSIYGRLAIRMFVESQQPQWKDRLRTAE